MSEEEVKSKGEIVIAPSRDVAYTPANLVGQALRDIEKWERNALVRASSKSVGLTRNPKDDAELVFIAGGKFLMGDDDRSDNPRHTVELTDYYIYKNVVTVEQYAAYCKAAGKSMPAAPNFNPSWSKGDHPIVNVDWHDARDYAQWAGGDLPSEAQWERAARGTDGRKFPWGNEYDSSKCWCSKEDWGDVNGTTSVGKYGVSPDGCTDMTGNVWQLCLDWYQHDFWNSKSSRVRNPINNTATVERVLRGGSWNSTSFQTSSVAPSDSGSIQAPGSTTTGSALSSEDSDSYTLFFCPFSLFKKVAT